jgi:hypothetical protein
VSVALRPLRVANLGGARSVSQCRLSLS